MYGIRGLGTISLAQAIFRQEGVVDSSGNWVTGSLGYRLNNPGNLNYAGQPGATPSGQGNGSEAQFDTLADGIAATNAQLALDASRGLTLAQRLQTWATGNQAAYVANVSSWLGVDPNTPLSQLVGSDSGDLALATPDSTVTPSCRKIACARDIVPSPRIPYMPLSLHPNSPTGVRCTDSAKRCREADFAPRVPIRRCYVNSWNEGFYSTGR